MSYTIRQSQAIHTWPAGAIIDFPNLSLIMLSHDDDAKDWGHNDNNEEVINKRKIIRDPRLEEAFNIQQFVAPPIEDGVNNLKLNSIRFPRTQRCPKCGLIYYLKKSDGEKEDPESNRNKTYNMRMTAYHCPDCFNYGNIKNSPRLIPMRFVIANEEGFLDDFPWDWYVHKDVPNERGKGHKLYWETKGGSASISDIKIVSKNIFNEEIAQRSLGKIFDQKIFTKKDSLNGHYLDYIEYKMPKPWKNWSNKEEFHKENIVDEQNILKNPKQEGNLTDYEKRKFPRTLQRGAGNLFFPVVYSGIKLPIVAYELSCPEDVKNIIIDIQRNASFVSPDTKNYTNEDWLNFFLERVEQDSDNQLLNLNYNLDDIKSYLQNYFKNSEGENLLNRNLKLRQEEYNTFCDSNIKESEEEWYKKIEISGAEYNTQIGFDLVDKIALLEKLNILKIYRGFTRVRPISGEEIIFADKRENLEISMQDEFDRLQDARKYPISTKELPAIETRGEGIFIKFNDSLLESWSVKYPNERLNIINENIDEMNRIFGSYTSHINKKYLFLHSLSHIIMKELSEDSGYSLSSLSEIIYCNSESQNLMNGILIYTSTPDSEGSMGGLVEKGKPESLSKIIRNGVDKVKWCSSDPLCVSAENGQGFMGLNLAACYSCLLLPETSCENINKYLDRATLVGTLDDSSIGLFNNG